MQKGQGEKRSGEQIHLPPPRSLARSGQVEQEGQGMSLSTRVLLMLHIRRGHGRDSPSEAEQAGQHFLTPESRDVRTYRPGDDRARGEVSGEGWALGTTEEEER